VGELPTAMWQLTEIAKALAQDARVLILDEPTAALARTETVQLFDLMRRLREQGISMWRRCSRSAIASRSSETGVGR
jgi:ribose transport system ATP-binding protein